MGHALQGFTACNPLGVGWQDTHAVGPGRVGSVWVCLFGRGRKLSMQRIGKAYSQAWKPSASCAMLQGRVHGPPLSEGSPADRPAKNAEYSRSGKLQHDRGQNCCRGGCYSASGAGAEACPPHCRAGGRRAWWRGPRRRRLRRVHGPLLKPHVWPARRGQGARALHIGAWAGHQRLAWNAAAGLGGAAGVAGSGKAGACGVGRPEKQLPTPLLIAEHQQPPGCPLRLHVPRACPACWYAPALDVGKHAGVTQRGQHMLAKPVVAGCRQVQHVVLQCFDLVL